MGWNIFKKGKNKLQNQEGIDFKTKIENALRNAENDKRDASNEIEKIRSWAAEVIVETYAEIFPNGHLTYYREKYKNDALENYEKYKTENADKIDSGKVEKCDKIVKAYLTQIKLRESKLQLYDKLVLKYKETKEKLKELELEKVAEDKITKHEERIKQLDGAENEYVDAMTDTIKLEELEREFELKAEYANQLSLLNEKYKDREDVEDYTTSLAFKDEIDKMINEIE
ncbi:MAG: hypothetical protein L3J35_00100 [Bacteroidales bacterium]|nr:hypothetical protein [Bacteroidales bacterium]